MAGASCFVGQGSQSFEVGTAFVAGYTAVAVAAAAAAAVASSFGSSRPDFVLEVQ